MKSLLFLFLLLPVISQASQVLKFTLQAQMSEHHDDVGYDRGRIFLMGDFYLRDYKDGSYGVKDVYCNRDRISNEFKKDFKPGPGLVPGPNIINVEHTWPQSKFASKYDKDMQKEDLHHLFPADTRTNASRANLPFGDVVTPTQNLKCKLSQVGYDAHEHIVFQPPPDHKGNVARAMFYFSVRYELEIGDDQEQVLRRWHHEDPVDEEELRRNEAIERLQGNRNVFIDQPDLVNQILDF